MEDNALYVGPIGQRGSGAVLNTPLLALDIDALDLNLARMQLVGSSLGSFLAATMIDDADVGGVLWFGAVSIGVAILLLVVSVARGRGSAAI